MITKVVKEWKRDLAEEIEERKIKQELCYTDQI